ncbi:MAG: hypothetical protein WAO19_01085 [Candidatus Kryptoniota bacterium]
MKPHVFAILLVSTALGIAGQVCLKYAINNYTIDFSNLPKALFALLTNVYVWGWFILAVAGTYTWMIVLKQMQVNLAFPIAQSLGYILLAIAAFYIFGEKLTATQLAGLGVILVGIVLTAL